MLRFAGYVWGREIKGLGFEIKVGTKKKLLPSHDTQSHAPIVIL